MIRAFLQRLRNPWVAMGTFLTAIVCLGLVLFIVQVTRSVRAIRAGAREDAFTASRRTALVQRVLSEPPLTESEYAYASSKTGEPTLGNPNAKIKIVEFLDYQCPFCAHSASAIRAFMAKHGQDVFLTLRDFPLEELHPQAMTAAIAARCVWMQKNEPVFWTYHDLLLGNQDRVSPQDLRAFALRAGADASAFDICVSQRIPERAIAASKQDGLMLRVQGTPTFFINGHRFAGAIDLEILEMMLQATLETKKDT